jgi:hypothetical protein
MQAYSTEVWRPETPIMHVLHFWWASQERLNSFQMFPNKKTLHIRAHSKTNRDNNSSKWSRTSRGTQVGQLG